MTGPGCSKNKGGEYRKHTPITSGSQKKLFQMVAAGVKTKATGLSKAEAKRHLAEVKGRRLARVAAKKKKS